MIVEQLRALGLPFGTVYPPTQHKENEAEEAVTTQRYVTWTTDEAKATEAQRLGARITRYYSSDPACSGWEISVTEVLP